jgi:streptomycin 6-kinase
LSEQPQAILRDRRRHNLHAAVNRLISATGTVQRRLAIPAARLDLDADRALRWAFAQGVLSALWSIEDGAAVEPTHAGLTLALAIRPLVG